MRFVILGKLCTKRLSATEAALGNIISLSPSLLSLSSFSLYLSLLPELGFKSERILSILFYILFFPGDSQGQEPSLSLEHLGRSGMCWSYIQKQVGKSLDCQKGNWEDTQGSAIELTPGVSLFMQSVPL